jgi:hypothetical protein
MSRKAASFRIAWEDRFSTPTVSKLLSALSREHAALVNHARKRLQAADESSEIALWCGVPWRWTLAYLPKDGGRPWAYLVPRPAGPLLGLPLASEQLQHCAGVKLSKHVRDGIAYAPRVGRTCWTQWDLIGKAQTDEILSIAHRCRQLAPATVA